ncbi:hypothetical protein KP509_15G040500 [Ceratopteris richardii]|uniref:Uncharacterized protein n=1 Tax=Ceratopteris richardii TaxID=49495 RepID=A0A8T2T6B7_CERRI|nr:hypothetical protein KP509_15G040500 [Ceratopteris richardii]
MLFFSYHFSMYHMAHKCCGNGQSIPNKHRIPLFQRMRFDLCLYINQIIITTLPSDPSELYSFRCPQICTSTRFRHPSQSIARLKTWFTPFVIARQLSITLRSTKWNLSYLLSYVRSSEESISLIQRIQYAQSYR